MPRFFDMNALTVEQKNRLEDVKSEYRNVQKINAQNSYQSLSMEDKEELKALLNNPTEEKLKQYLLDCSNLNGGDEKSALFFRLLNNKPPLKYSPPCSYSYPWYSVIEEKVRHQLSLEAKNIHKIMQNGMVSIEQTSWEVLEIISSTEAIVTYGKWKELGFKWRLFMDKILCKDSISFIVSHHNKALDRITTLKQLRKEQEYQVLKSLNNILLVLHPEEQEKYKEDLVKQYGGFANGMFIQQLHAGEEMLFQRLNKGLSDYPNEAEIERMIDYNLGHYLNKDISVDQEGNLLTQIWCLERIEQPVEEDIYMDKSLYQVTN